MRARKGMVEGIELMMDALVPMDAAMHLLRVPDEEPGDQQGSPGDHDGADARWQPRPADVHASWSATSGLDRPAGFV